MKLTQKNKLLPTKIFEIAGLDGRAIDRKLQFVCSYQGDGVLSATKRILNKPFN